MAVSFKWRSSEAKFPYIRALKLCIHGWAASVSLLPRRFRINDDNMIVKPHPGNPTNSELNRLHFRPLLAVGAD
jgi:hypothetical protein